MSSSSTNMSSDLTFLTNEAGKSLRDRFGVLLGDDTRCCLIWMSPRRVRGQARCRR